MMLSARSQEQFEAGFRGSSVVMKLMQEVVA